MSDRFNKVRQALKSRQHERQTRPLAESGPPASSVGMTVSRIACTPLPVHALMPERPEETPHHRIVAAIDPSAGAASWLL